MLWIPLDCNIESLFFIEFSLFINIVNTHVLFINTLLLIIIKLSNLIKVNNENYEVNSYLNNYNEEVGYINKEEYLGILEIKKIKLRKGFYKLNSNLNNVDKNIAVLMYIKTFMSQALNAKG